MTIIKSRAAKLAAVVPNAPKHCPACERIVGTHFQAFYNGDPEIPETVQLAAWRCEWCGTVHTVS